MKKALKISVLALSILGMAACGNTNTSASAETSVSVAQYDDATIKFTTNVKEIEKGDTQKLRIRVDTLGEDKTAIFSSEQDGDIISFESSTTGVTSVDVKGLAYGEATITATSTVNPTVSVSITITVTKVMPALAKAYRKMSANSNYTMTSRYVDDDGEEGEINQITKVTEDGITVTDEDGNAKLEVSGVKLLGVGVDANDNVYYLGDDVSIASTAITISGTGLLKRDTFMGLSDSAASPNDVSTFFGYQAINPSWLSSDKRDGENNAYEIAEEDTSSTDSYYSAFVEYIAWNFADISSWANATATSWFTLADSVDTTFTVTGTEKVDINVVVNGSDEYKVTISDIGTTELDSKVSAFIADETNVAEKPAVNNEIKYLRDGLASNIYELTETFYITPDDTNYTEIPYNIYFTPNYLWLEYPEESRETYKSVMGEELEDEDTGLIAMADGVHNLSYTAAVTDGDGNVVTPEAAVVGDIASGYSTGETLPEYYGYLSQCDGLYGDPIYSLYSTKETIFTGYPSSYYTEATELMTYLYAYLFGSTPSSNYYYITMISVVTGVGEDGKTTVATGGEIDIAYSQDYQYWGIASAEITHINDIDNSVCSHHDLFMAASTYVAE